MVLGELLSHPGDGHPHVSCARADQRHRGLQRIVAVVAGSPPDHLLEQVGLKTTAH